MGSEAVAQGMRRHRSFTVNARHLGVFLEDQPKALPGHPLASIVDEEGALLLVLH